MNEFFSSIYSWFCSRDLDVFKAMNAIYSDEDELLSGSFPAIGITALVISVLIAVAFYIWPINHPRFKAWWSWLIMLAINAAINFGLAFAFIQHRIGDINENSQEAIEVLTDDETLSIPFAQWMDFALSNLCVSVMFFIAASLVLMWFSTNCRYSPFRK